MAHGILQLKVLLIRLSQFQLITSASRVRVVS